MLLIISDRITASCTNALTETGPTSHIGFMFFSVTGNCVRLMESILASTSPATIIFVKIVSGDPRKSDGDCAELILSKSAGPIKSTHHKPSQLTGFNSCFKDFRNFLISKLLCLFCLALHC